MCRKCFHYRFTRGFLHMAEKHWRDNPRKAKSGKTMACGLCQMNIPHPVAAALATQVFFRLSSGLLLSCYSQAG